jgi:RNA polymerase sigma-70 factor (ECF subfamily)
LFRDDDPGLNGKMPKTLFYLSEKELIEGCRQGNKACQYELFHRYAGKMLTLCRRYARHQMEAEDWLQDSFVKIFENIHRFREEGSLEGWMKRIVVNTALKHLRKVTFQKEELGSDGLPEPSVAPSAFSQLGEEELLKLIANLPEGYRIIFNLHAIEGFSHREIANMLNIEESTSRSQLTKARKMLQKQISDLQKITL